MVQYGMIQYCVVEYGMAWYSRYVVEYGMAWYGVILPDRVKYGVVWYSVAHN